MTTLENAVATVLEGWTLPIAVRKILETAYYASPPTPEAQTTNQDATRYKKLRNWMSSNVKEGWNVVCQPGAVAAWQGWDDFDEYLDSLPECDMGLCSKPNPTSKEDSGNFCSTLPISEKALSNIVELPKPIAIGCTCSVCGEWQFSTTSGMVCSNGHGGASGINHRLYIPEQVRDLLTKYGVSVLEDDPCPGCEKGHVCRTPKCGRLKLSLNHPYRTNKEI